MLLMVEKGIRAGICHSMYKYAKANDKYMKTYNRNKESSYINVGMWIICMVQQCHKSFQKIILSG